MIKSLCSFFRRRTDLFFILILLISAAPLYFIYLSVYPPGLHGDEAWTGIEATRILKDGSIGIWSHAAYGEPSIRFYYVALLFKLFGPSLEMLRYASVLLHWITIPFFYGIVSLLFTRRIAFFSTVLFICMHPLLLFAKRADFVTFSFPFYPALFFFLLGLKTNMYRYFFLGGIFLGLCLYGYFSLWVTPLLFLLISVYLAFFHKKQFFKVCNPLTVFFVSSIIVASPMLIFMITNKNTVFSRMQYISSVTQDGVNKEILQKDIQVIQFFTQGMWKNIQMFFSKGAVDPWDNINQKPLYSIFEAILLLCGLIYTIIHLRKKSYAILLVWFFFFLFLSAFTNDAPNYRRTQLSIAASCILFVVGIDLCIHFIFSRVQVFWKKSFKHLSVLEFITIFVFVFTVSISKAFFFFQIFTTAKEVKQQYAYSFVESIKTLDKLKTDYYIYLYSDSWPFHHETRKFLLPEKRGESRSHMYGKYSLVNTNTQGPVLYLFFPEYKNDFLKVQKLYPDGKQIVQNDVKNNELFYLFALPKQE